MGDEADADWQDGLVEDGREWVEDQMRDAMYAGYRRKHRSTAIRVRGRSFETVELDDNGKVIEPVRCTCGCYAVVHMANCPIGGRVT